MLQQMLNDTELIAANTNNTDGTCTRVNRKNANEKLIIDYILVSKKLQKLITKTTIDEEESLRLKGKNETDHNTITVEMKINAPREKTFRTKWEEGWKKMNEDLQRWRVDILTYDQAEKEIIQILKSTVGQAKIQTDKPWKTETEEIRAAKTAAIKWKKEYKEICRDGNSEQRTESKEKCIESTKPKNETRKT